MKARSPMDVRDARSVALCVLEMERREGLFIQEALNRLTLEVGLRSNVVAFATELALGVTRHRLTLRHLVCRFLHGRWSNFKPALRQTLLLGAYQLIYLDRVEASVAVDRAVEQAKAVGGRKAGALVNAVLRNLLRHQTSNAAVENEAAATHCIEVGDGRFVVFDEAIFPDPNKDEVEALSLRTSHPAWLVRHWVRAHGSQRADQICRAGMSRPEIFLRPNRMRVSAEELCDRLRAEGAEVELDAERGMVHWRGGPPLRALAAFDEGLFQPQDPTAKSVVDRIAPKPGQVVVDLCAAPGTKCTYMAELMSDRGVIYAADRSPERLAMIETNAKRLGLSIIRVLPADELAGQLADHAGPDVVLVDAPCSNTGVLSRRPEARYRLRPERLADFAQVQQKLLEEAARLAGPKTRLVYSTCSIEKEENETVVQAFLKKVPGYRLQDSRLTLPDAGKSPTRRRDGGFVAELVPVSQGGEGRKNRC